MLNWFQCLLNCSSEIILTLAVFGANPAHEAESRTSGAIRCIHAMIASFLAMTAWDASRNFGTIRDKKRI
jgi:hypothetical protein